MPRYSVKCRISYGRVGGLFLFFSLQFDARRENLGADMDIYIVKFY
jgi:hypothetical protein